jgi:hypothetical protein
MDDIRYAQSCINGWVAPVPGNVDAARDPDLVAPLHIIEKRSSAAACPGPPDDPAMQPTDSIFGRFRPSGRLLYRTSKASFR